MKRFTYVTQQNNLWPYYFYIPDGSEKINKNSYIAMMVAICTEPNGEVMIIDEGSKQELYSYYFKGMHKSCNYYGNQGFDSFVSDSNKVIIRVIYRMRL